MKIKYTLLVAIFCSLSLMAVRSHAQSPASATPAKEVLSTKTGSNIVVLQKQACSALAAAWEPLIQLSESYNGRAEETSGNKRDAWCEKYDTVVSVLSRIKTYYEASCQGESESLDGSGGYNLQMMYDVTNNPQEGPCDSQTEDVEFIYGY